VIAMLSKINKLKQPFLRFSKWFTAFDENSIKPFEIDFSKPWWSPYLSVKRLIGVVFVSTILVNLYTGFFPLWLGIIFQSRSFHLIWIPLSLYFVVNFIFDHYSGRANQILQAKLENSLQTKNQQALLTTDPIFHTTRSSGEIISKISRIYKYTSLFENIIWGIVSNFSGAFFAGLSLFAISTTLGIIAQINIIVVTFLCYVILHFTTVWHEDELIKLNDKESQDRVDNISQTTYIRANFATTARLNIYLNSFRNAKLMDMQKWRMFDWIFWLLKLISYTSFMVIIYVSVGLVQNGEADVELVLPVVLGYFANSSALLWQGYTVTNILENYTNIKDYWKFMQGIPAGTYPVLDK
jgi:ABC-type bacteriocin/lantibiotic exporter with double-glycine peptidase domain